MVKPATDLQELISELKEGLERSGLPILNEATISVNKISEYDILSGTPTWKLREVADRVLDRVVGLLKGQS